MQSPALELLWEYCQTFFTDESPTPISAAQLEFPIEELRASLAAISPSETRWTPDATNDSILVADGRQTSGRTDAAVFKQLVLRRNVVYPQQMQPGDAPTTKNVASNPRDPASSEAASLPPRPPYTPPPSGTFTEDDLAAIKQRLEEREPEELFAVGATSTPPSDARAENRGRYFRLMVSICSDIVDAALLPSVDLDQSGPGSSHPTEREALLRHAYSAWRKRHFSPSLESIEESLQIGIRHYQALRRKTDQTPPPTAS
jgi:hypothetical protein